MNKRKRMTYQLIILSALSAWFCFGVSLLKAEQSASDAAKERGKGKKSVEELSAELKAAKSQEEQRRLWEEIKEAAERKQAAEREAAEASKKAKPPEVYERRIVSGDGRYTAITRAKLQPMGDGEGYSGRGSIFQYLDKDGKVLWEKKDVVLGERLCSVSQNGKRVFLVEVRHDEESPDDLEIYNKEPVLYDEQGNVLWSFGVFDTVYEVYLTKNGKYGYIRGSQNQKLTDLTFFDVEKKQIHKTEDIGRAHIREDGKARVYKTVNSIYVEKNGEVYFDDKTTEFFIRKHYNNLTSEDYKLFTEEEFKKIREAVKEKKNVDLSREKTVYEYSFR